MARGEIHIQLVVNYSEDPALRKVARYGKDARAIRDLWVQMVCYCKRNLTDGHIPADEVPILVYPDPPKIGVRDADRLVELGIAERTDTGYYLPGFLKRNKSRAEVEAESAEKAKNGAKGGKVSGQVRRGEANAKQPASLERSSREAQNPDHLNTESEYIGIDHRSDTESFLGSVERESSTPVTAKLELSPFCSKHPNGVEGACRDCATARVSLNARTSAREQRRLDTDRARTAARAACQRCDDKGWLLDNPDKPARCNHQPLIGVAS